MFVIGDNNTKNLDLSGLSGFGPGMDHFVMDERDDGFPKEGPSDVIMAIFMLRDYADRMAHILYEAGTIAGTNPDFDEIYDRFFPQRFSGIDPRQKY